MRLPRVRFTVRALMVAVAALAIPLSIEATRRRQSYLATADAHEARETDALFRKRAHASAADDPGLIQGLYDGERAMRTALYHARLKRKYRAAAARPWAPVAPDPPPPAEPPMPDRQSVWEWWAHWARRYDAETMPGGGRNPMHGWAYQDEGGEAWRLPVEPDPPPTE